MPDLGRSTPGYTGSLTMTSGGVPILRHAKMIINIAQRETVAFAVLGVRPSAGVAQPSDVEWREVQRKTEVKPGVEWSDVG